MPKYSLNISRIGGKWRLVNRLKKYTPFHDSFLSLFCGACWYEINKPRARFEVFNDKDSELINYLLIVKDHSQEFEKLKDGVFSLVSKEIFERIINEKLKPQNDIERAYFFFYVNKWSFGGNNAKNYRGETMKIPNYQGLSIKTTRPHTSNDKGLLTPLDPKAIKRLQYVNITNYDYDHCYALFERALTREKKENSKQIDPDEILIFADPPYPSTEEYYENIFTEKDHEKLIDMFNNSPFKFMLTIGGECELYLKELNHHFIKKMKVRYNTSANNQYERDEYLIMNYDPSKVPIMKEPTTKLITDF